MSQRLDHMGYFIQFYGYIRGFLKLIRFGYTIQQSNDLKETNQLRFEYYLAMAALISNIVIDITQYGLSRLGQHLKGIPLHFISQYSNFKKIAFKVGLKCSRFGGPLLILLSSGFDIYHA